MDIKTEITTLVETGFNKEEIIQKLRDKGFAEMEINRGYDDFLAAKRLAKWDNLSLPKWVMMLGASIALFGLLYYGPIDLVQIAFLLAIGAITAFALTIYFFIQENDFGISRWSMALIAAILLFAVGWLLTGYFISPFLMFTAIITTGLTIYFFIKKK